MKCLTLLTAAATLFAFASASAKHFVKTNGTHFVDEHTGHKVKHFGCGAKKEHASEHFLKTIKKLHDQHKNSNVGTRAALPAAKKAKAAAKKKKAHVAQDPASGDAAAAPSSADTAAPPADAAPAASSSSSSGSSGGGIPINAYFHIISTNANKGTITQAMADSQAQALNTAYAAAGFSFNVVNTSFTTNDAWAVADGSAMDEAKAALRAGTYADLNIYFHTDLSGGNLGTCTLPSQVPPGATQQIYISDGCNVNANTMPGGTMMGYNQGMTAVHETGHWLGLLHTFEGYSCEGDGDLIVDTRMEASSTDGCPVDPAKNTCPNLDGDDPIHNYMDYSTDACYEGFSDGQIARMQELWGTYRKGN